MMPGEISPSVTGLEETIARLKEQGFEIHAKGSAELLRTAALATKSGANLIITGETGVGKRRLARLIHRLSPESSGPLIIINAGDLTPDWILRRAQSGGTLILLEIEDLSPEAQTCLLNLLNQKEAGSLSRFISTTSIDLENRIEDVSFDSDLYRHLAIVTLSLPPLRNRPTDLEDISAYFISRFRDVNRRIAAERLTPGALEKLKDYSWPGNIRELQSVIARAVQLSESIEITPENIVFAADFRRSIPLTSLS